MRQITPAFWQSCPSASLKKRAQEESDRILKEAGDQAADIMRKAEKNIENEREKTMADLQSRIAELAVSAARKMTGDTGHGSEDSLLYDRFLKEAEGHETDVLSWRQATFRKFLTDIR